MSRLYLALDEASAFGARLSGGPSAQLPEKFLESHAELSTHAFIEVSFDLNLRRPALVSDNSGWNSYPVRLRAERRGANAPRTGPLRDLFLYLPLFRGAGAAAYPRAVR